MTTSTPVRTSDRPTVLDVVLAVDGDEPAFRCTEIRQSFAGQNESDQATMRSWLRP